MRHFNNLQCDVTGFIIKIVPQSTFKKNLRNAKEAYGYGLVWYLNPPPSLLIPSHFSCTPTSTVGLTSLQMTKAEKQRGMLELAPTKDDSDKDDKWDGGDGEVNSEENIVVKETGGVRQRRTGPAQAKR